MIDGQKVGCGIATCRRPNELQRLYQSLPLDVLDALIIVNDGQQALPQGLRQAHIVNNRHNLGVGKTKNIAMRWLLEQGVEHVFLLEDDIFIREPDIFARYVRAARISGIQHLNFCPFGPAPLNREVGGGPAPLARLDLGDGLAIDLYPQLVAPMSYFSRLCLEQAGLYDEQFYNAMEHVEHTLRVIECGMHPPFGYFADVAGSHLAIGGDDWSPGQSIINATTPERNKVVELADRQFEAKHGYHLTKIRRPGIAGAMQALLSISQRFGVGSRGAAE